MRELDEKSQQLEVDLIRDDYARSALKRIRSYATKTRECLFGFVRKKKAHAGEINDDDEKSTQRAPPWSGPDSCVEKALKIRKAEENN